MATLHRQSILDGLQAAGVETIHIRVERPLSILGTEQAGAGLPSIQVREERLGRPRLRPLHEVSLLLERYNQVFVIENIYCPPDQYARGMDVLRGIQM